MTPPTVAPFVYRPGEIVVEFPAHGYAQAKLRDNRDIILAAFHGSNGATVRSFAVAVRDHAEVLAENARLRAVLERIVATHDASFAGGQMTSDADLAGIAGIAGIARAALRGPADATPAEIAATLARVEAGDLTPSAGGAPP